MKEYLTESELRVKWVPLLFEGEDVICDKSVPDSKSRCRPDFRIDALMLIIEFDGYQHYTTPSVIVRDMLKDDLYRKMGYHVIHIPYFIQMSTEIIKILFNKEISVEQQYPHGFHDKSAIIPAAFCTLGLNRFKKDLDTFNIVADDIRNSLNIKVKELGNSHLVYNVMI